MNRVIRKNVLIMHDKGPYFESSSKSGQSLYYNLHQVLKDDPKRIPPSIKTGTGKLLPIWQRALGIWALRRENRIVGHLPFKMN